MSQDDDDQHRQNAKRGALLIADNNRAEISPVPTFLAGAQTYDNNHNNNRTALSHSFNRSYSNPKGNLATMSADDQAFLDVVSRSV